MKEEDRMARWQPTTNLLLSNLENLGVPEKCLGFDSATEILYCKSLEPWPIESILVFLRHGEPHNFREWMFAFELRHLLSELNKLVTSHPDKEQQKKHPLPEVDHLAAAKVPVFGPMSDPHPFFKHTQRVWRQDGTATIEYYEYCRM
jgi:hypothetical protein